jgi:hypothetical protein
VRPKEGNKNEPYPLIPQSGVFLYIITNTKIATRKHPGSGYTI